MKVAISRLADNSWLRHPVSGGVENEQVQLVLCFSAKHLLHSEELYIYLRREYPSAEIAICSTAGEIYHDTVNNDTAVITAMQFDGTQVRTAMVDIRNFSNSYDAAAALLKELPAEELTYVMILSDGSLVNGSELVKGFQSAKENILVTGGLAGDAADFKSTLVGLNQQPSEGKILAVGFYGQRLKVTHGSQGGWDMFGLEKEITRSSGNKLYEIENENALDTYKRYLGPDAENLPGSALLFPIAVIIPGESKPVVRTILSINEADRSMTFAGDVPEGSKLRFMRANFDSLTMAAATAAHHAMLEDRKPDFSLLVSCVGRKLILGPRIEEEVEAVCDTVGAGVPVAGFYSYGEISPFNEGGGCQLHNQTMTITSFYELP